MLHNCYATNIFTDSFIFPPADSRIIYFYVRNIVWDNTGKAGAEAIF
jgi:hypothetical protein